MKQLTTNDYQMIGIFRVLIVFMFISYANAQNQQCKCCSENHTEFDFWVGEWTVTKPDGTLAGYNIIEKIQDRCVLRENWSSAKGGFTGTSLNFYNGATKQWEQIWVDNQGGSLHLKGNRVGNQMILKTDVAKNKKGEPFYHKITWTKHNDGSVRQYWETITNDKDVTVVFNGLYKKNE
ncbi:hypothetical protein [Aestuariivivens insulae]|uniref:hypothetical protein n=1 Tax=Aestuariivivens insulae TaxID=1621988 RepID=UPI001F587906|nr:hypothetical protein [Aestuariivivens insulae]